MSIPLPLQHTDFPSLVVGVPKSLIHHGALTPQKTVLSQRLLCALRSVPMLSTSKQNGWASTPTIQWHFQAVLQLLMGHLEGHSWVVTCEVLVGGGHNATAWPSLGWGVVVSVDPNNHGALQLKNGSTLSCEFASYHVKFDKYFLFPQSIPIQNYFHKTYDPKNNSRLLKSEWRPLSIQMSARHIEWYVFKFNAFFAVRQGWHV